MRLINRSLLTAAAGMTLVAAPAAHAATAKTLHLPAGFSAEAMTAHDGALYVGSQIDGTVLRVDVKTGEQTTAVLGRPGVHSNGIRFADGRIIVAGGTTGKIYVYSAHDGKPVRTYDVKGGFVNGVGVLGHTAYATDTLKHVIYALPTSGRGAVRTIAPTGDFKPNPFDLDGIIPAGGQLLSGQYGTGILYKIDPRTGVARTVDLGRATVPTNDGMMRNGRHLYIAENRGKVQEVQLNGSLTAGKIVKTIPRTRLRNPVDVARIDGHLWVLNANNPQRPKPTDVDDIIDLGGV
jgi:sugar lactone lactonase YvrE